ncbi:GNAT family N-acetyltransferase [Flavilitoribacter nigricans]|uniref:N-acetyltransferase n=1 Tax=Flavilitoribacter nigricans (strain ATCC 23147 / DSM 23189 / NBRC 102662 / NCIMB 1420 / SS-2) TaxID=1122177 RepID=A0A2D0NHB5_FLAN2|nr:GNAT family N-acetyltransferase [Flavilitoribacter nigricans]PHN07867.1 N-acetyltransferase [Flavilitoribacter nigricans DSM 23189 = NBRC 102662]
MPPPDISLRKVTLTDILPLRALYLQEHPVQIRYDACHVRNWSTPYAILQGAQMIGYAAVKGREELADRDAIFEWYLLPEFRRWNGGIFTEMIRFTAVSYVESQTNEPQLTALLYRFCNPVFSDTILFADHQPTDHQLSGVVFRRRNPEDDVFGLKPKDAGDYVLEKDGLIVATGGYLTHYNPPFADLYMETHPEFRNQGLSSYLLQEVKKECYRAGYRPAARCNIRNEASRSCLQKAGFRICGFMMIGEISPEYLA